MKLESHRYKFIQGRGKINTSSAQKVTLSVIFFFVFLISNFSQNCTLQGLRLRGTDQTYCQGSELLKSVGYDINKTSADYVGLDAYAIIVDPDDKYKIYSSQVLDLSSLTVGEYQLYVYITRKNPNDSDNRKDTFTEYRKGILNSCIDYISVNHIPITIEEQPAVLEQTLLICQGQNKVVIEGSSYDIPPNRELLVEIASTDPCPKIVKYFLKEEKPDYTRIEPGVLGCEKASENTTIGIKTSDDVRVAWYSDGPSFQTKNKGKQATASSEGNYTAIIYYGSDYQCSIEEKFAVSQESSLPKMTVKDIDLGCSSGQSIAIDLQASNYDKFMLTGPNGFSSSDPKASISALGTYNAEITKNNCTLTKSFSLSKSDKIKDLEILSATQNKVCGDDTQALSLVSKEADYIGYLDVKWYDSDNNLIGDGLSVITASNEVTAKINNPETGCTQEETSKVNYQYDPIDLQLSSHEAILYCSPLTADIDFEANSKAGIEIVGSGSSIIDLNNGKIRFRNAGRFEVVASYNGLCPVSKEVEITSSSPTVNVNDQVTPISCGKPGSISVSSGSISSPRWVGPNGFTDNKNLVLEGLENPGTYTLIFKDEETGCELTHSVDLKVDGALQDANIESVKIIASNDGVIDCSVQEVELFAQTNSCKDCSDFKWIRPDGSEENGASIKTSKAGSYEFHFKTSSCSEEVVLSQQVIVDNKNIKPSIIIRDKGCTVTGRLLIRNYTDFVEIHIYDSDSMDINPSGEVEYFYAGLQKGTYVAEYTPYNGCSYTEEFTIEQDENLPSYRILQEDASYCQDKPLQIQVDRPNSDDLNVVLDKAILPDSSTLTVNAYKSILLPAGEEEVTLIIRNSLGCRDTTTYTIEKENPIIPFSPSATSFSSCQDMSSASITNALDSNYSYIWTLPDGSTRKSKNLKNDLIIGSYSVAVFDEESGCDTTYFFDVSIEEDNNKLEIVSEDDFISCTNPTLALTSTFTDTLMDFEWRKEDALIGQSDSVFVTEAGLYIVKGRASNGCIYSASKEIENISYRYVDSYPSTLRLDCDGQLNIVPTQQLTSDFEFTWFDQNGAEIGSGQSFITKNLGDIVGVVYDKKSGCTSNEQISVEPNDAFGDLDIDVKNKNCEQDFGITIKNPQNASLKLFKIESGTETSVSIPVSSVTAGDYRLEGTKDECSFNYEFSVLDFSDREISIIEPVKIPFLVCDQRSIKLSPEVNNTSEFTEYTWTLNGVTVSEVDTLVVTESGNYTLKAYDPLSQCQDEVQYAIEDRGVETLDLEVAPLQLPCISNPEGSLVAVSADSKDRNLVYSFDGGESWQDVPNQSVTMGGEYQIKVRDQYGCKGEAVGLVTEYELLDAWADIPLDPISLGSSFDFTIEVNKPNAETSLNWTYGDQIDACTSCNEVSIESVNSLEPVYIVIQDNEGCEERLQIYLPLDTEENEILMPNVINLNFSDQNGEFTIANKNAFVTIDHFALFSANGEKLIEEKNLSTTEPLISPYVWESKIQQMGSPNGVYIYQISATDILGRTSFTTGELTVLQRN